MTKPKYATAAERQAAMSVAARNQMLAQWERQREESGQELGYFGGHRRARTQRGRAADQSCVTCGSRARHWAQIHGTSGADPGHYQPMCQKCHWAYDGVGAKVVAAKGAAGRRNLALKAWETKRRKNGEASAALGDARPGPG